MNIGDLSESQRYYLDGILKDKFKNTESLARCKDILLNLLESDNLQDGFYWSEKYKDTKDLRPNCFEYDPCFIDILIENNLHERIKSLTSMDYTLSHIQIRKSNCKENSYMPWHRDAYVIGDKLVGNIPPSHKIIYYPKIKESNPSPRLSILKGTHLCMYQGADPSHFMLPGFSTYDNEFGKISKKIDYTPSDDEYVIFNTSALHNANLDDNDGSIRIIYSFVLDFQFKEKYAHKKEHKDLNDLYREMVSCQ